MVKGISRQVIVLHAPEQKLFEQAIFILNEEALRDGGVTDDVLMKEAKRLMGERNTTKRKKSLCGAVYAFCGALAMALIWGVTLLF